MFKFLKKYFTADAASVNAKQNCCQIVFSLQTDGSTITELYWPEFTDSFTQKQIENLAIEYGTLLYLIGSGDYKTDINNTLIKAKSSNTSDGDQTFVSTVQFQMSFLETFKKKYNTANPIISPTQVFIKK
jgi:hypothetical protein